MKRREFPKTFHISEPQKEEFYLPKFKSEELKTRDDRDQEFSLGHPERTTAHFREEGGDLFERNNQEPMTFRETKLKLDEDDELFHSEMQKIETVRNYEAPPRKMWLTEEEIEYRMRGVKLDARPKTKYFKGRGIFLIREWRFLSVAAFTMGMMALVRFLIDLINS